MRIAMAKYQWVNFLNAVCRSTKKRKMLFKLKVDVDKARIHCSGFSADAYIIYDVIDECDPRLIAVNIADLRRLKNVLLALEEQPIIIKIEHQLLKLEVIFDTIPLNNKEK